MRYRRCAGGHVRLSPALQAAASALGAARASEERWRTGQPLSPLDGVPATIKDLVLMRGFPTLRGSRLVDPEQDWSEDGPAVARLREAGAVILGKTTTPEFGWKAIGDSPLTGVTRNPWDLDRTPGGSSGGAAAAVAGGIFTMATGGDGGGSIRINRPELQSHMFRALGIGDEEARERFGFLLEAFRDGAPPHGGIALGFDRMVMLMSRSESLREVIAFPKTARAQDLMSEAPANVDKKQLDELGIEFKR